MEPIVHKDRIWNIDCKGKVMKARSIKLDVQRNEPAVYFEEEGRKFSIEFLNKSDYMASAYGTKVKVMVISANRSVRHPGAAANLKI